MLTPNPRGHEHKMPGGDSRRVKCLGGQCSFGFSHTWITMLNSGLCEHMTTGDLKRVKCLDGQYSLGFSHMCVALRHTSLKKKEQRGIQLFCLLRVFSNSDGSTSLFRTGFGVGFSVYSELEMISAA